MKTDALTFLRKMYAPPNYTDEDSLPVRAVPRPLDVEPVRVDSLSDLDVSLTPDKIGKSVGILKKREGPGGDVASGRVSRRQVRFDTGSASEGSDKKALISDDPDRQEEGTRAVDTALELASEETESNVQTVTNPSSIVSSDRKDKGPRDHIDSWKTRAIKAARPSKACKPPKQGGLLGGAEDHGAPPLATPEYNTTLALGQELQRLREAGFDAKKAAAEQLKRSSVTRNCIEGKVAEGLNVPKDQQRYKGLVSLEVPVDEVLSVAAQEKMLLVKPRPESKKVTEMEAPNLMMFYDPLELLTETPYLSVEGLPVLKVRPQPKPAASSFDLFRKLKQWEA
ncbi:protein phosphatase 1 regulatory subunit 35 isoform X2 [Rhincodon typus]|uniref:protein phosphatase 1 regulatory subunit 35 isoform X2 n=1 Tax=Rhincodon typus TaxID=259920 RepID=UPI00202E16B8|nr:protein phosphatase 1 regulatory subunit 35 isoform X2 [Rhincodon typus]XP_048475957.1 protein phosphatase 1 regulatory subunit 35 isoform X2 [Rhincodon typus]